MNEYQQALVRIIELEDRNAELLEALEALSFALNTLAGEGIKVSVGAGFMVIDALNRADEAIRKGEQR